MPDASGSTAGSTPAARRPAAVFGLERKGRLLPGADADVVVFDPERELTLGPAVLHSAIEPQHLRRHERQGMAEDDHRGEGRSSCTTESSSRTSAAAGCCARSGTAPDGIWASAQRRYSPSWSASGRGDHPVAGADPFDRVGVPPCPAQRRIHVDVGVSDAGHRDLRSRHDGASGLEQAGDRRAPSEPDVEGMVLEPLLEEQLGGPLPRRRRSASRRSRRGCVR